jgi:TRAP-type mannitol/chloroaromatic compound transport system permease small subunit
MDGITVGFVMPHWLYWGLILAVPPIIMFLVWRAEKKPDHGPVPDEELALDLLAQEDPAMHAPGNALTHALDWISNKTGVFVALWTIIPVCFYTYEVVSRQIFGLPTIWVHEGSYLLFGMQYLVAGGYALLHGSHVRVDVLYVKLPERGRVGMDIFTSVFFFIFALTLLGTGWQFFEDSYQMQEVTMETWGIQHWPVKGVMVLGSALLILAGISKLIKDIMLFCRMGEDA